MSWLPYRSRFVSWILYRSRFVSWILYRCRFVSWIPHVDMLTPWLPDRGNVRSVSWCYASWQKWIYVIASLGIMLLSCLPGKGWLPYGGKLMLWIHHKCLWSMQCGMLASYLPYRIELILWLPRKGKFMPWLLHRGKPTSCPPRRDQAIVANVSWPSLAVINHDLSLKTESSGLVNKRPEGRH